MTSARTRLDELATEHHLPADAPARLERLLGLLATDPAAPTTVTHPAQAADVHVADSLAGLEIAELRRARTIADLGAGAGFPGIPLAIALPHAELHLLESQSRKCAFLGRAVEAAGTTNAHIACARAEEWSRRDAGAVTARAVAPLAVLLEYAAPILRSGGVLIAWKGHVDDAEEEAARRAAAELNLERAEVRAVRPFPAAERRTLHVYAKVGPTPERFPRRPGMARKRPLGA